MVLENPQILDLFKGPLVNLGGQSLKGSDLEIHLASPRHYLEYSNEHFDIIQLARCRSYGRRHKPACFRSTKTIC